MDHANLAAALVAALAELTVVEKGRTAKIPLKDGGSYTYGFADIADVVKLTRPVLAEHGLVALTPVHDHGSGLACTVTLLHTSGDRLDLGPFPFPHGKDAQATGSMVTYHRRYALVAALGMAAGDDDDGAAAAPRQEQVAAPPVPGFRSSLMAATENLSEAERTHLRLWLVEQGLPDRPSKMNAAQADRVCDYILHALPASTVPGQDATTAPSEAPGAPETPQVGSTEPEASTEPQDATPETAPEPAQDGPFDREGTARWLDSLDDLTVADMLTEYDLPGTGTKVAKRKRILDHLEADAGESGEDPAAGDVAEQGTLVP